jgi:peptidoglycan hydrolase CwlO-like protein
MDIMRKQILAAVAAILITGTIAMSMFVVGTNALANQNGTAASNSPATAAAASSSGVSSSASTQAQIAQLQAQLAQYQARDQQYQAALNSDNTQLAQATSEIQMIQQLLTYLQQRGLIQIDSNGQIFVTGGR